MMQFFRTVIDVNEIEKTSKNGILDKVLIGSNFDKKSETNTLAHPKISYCSKFKKNMSMKEESVSDQTHVNAKQMVFNTIKYI